MKRLLYVLAAALLLLSVGCASETAVSETSSEEPVSVSGPSSDSSVSEMPVWDGSTPFDDFSDVSIVSDEPSASEDPSATSEGSDTSQSGSGKCAHSYPEEPSRVVGNLDIYTCEKCGFEKVVQNGIPIG